MEGMATMKAMKQGTARKGNKEGNGTMNLAARNGNKDCNETREEGQQ